MNAVRRSVGPLEPLALVDWQATKTTLHLWTQIIGKIRLETTPAQNNGWHASLQLTPRGLAALGMHANGRDFELELDFVDHKLIGRTSTGEKAFFEIRDGLSVGAFYAQTMELLRKLQIRVAITARPYGMAVTTPFADDVEHNAYDPCAVLRWWNAARFTANLLDDFASHYAGTQSPVHVFWPSLDLGYTRDTEPGDPQHIIGQPETAPRRVIAAGFWLGDEQLPEPTFYTYAAPEPKGLIDTVLRPAAARWVPSGNGHLAVLSYETVRTSADAHKSIRDFFAAGFEAGSAPLQWPLQAVHCRLYELQASVATEKVTPA